MKLEDKFMKEVKIEKCPYCGGEELIESDVDSMGGRVCVANGPVCRAVLFATVCRDCGSVVRFFCKSAENLYPKKERRE